MAIMMPMWQMHRKRTVVESRAALVSCEQATCNLHIIITTTRALLIAQLRSEYLYRKRSRLALWRPVASPPCGLASLPPPPLLLASSSPLGALLELTGKQPNAERPSPHSATAPRGPFWRDGASARGHAYG